MTLEKENFDKPSDSPKIKKTLEIVNKHMEKEKIIIFTHFLVMIQCLGYALENRGIKYEVRL